MRYDEICLTFFSSINKTADDFFPFIEKVIPNCQVKKTISSLKITEILKPGSFFYYKNSDIKNYKDKIFSLLLTLMGKNFRSRFCSYRKIIASNLLTETSPYKFIVYGYHIYDLFSINTQYLNEKSFIFSLDGIYTKYLWEFELLKLRFKNNTNTDTKCCIVYNCFSLSFLLYIKAIYPNAKIIARYHDMVLKEKHIHFIKKIKSIKGYIFESYSQTNANMLNINYWPNSVDFQFLKKNYSDTTKKFDIYFLGVADNNRLQFLKCLISTLCKQNITFYINAVAFSKDNKDKIKNELLKLTNSSSIINVDPISYANYLSNIAKCKAVIDFYRLNSDEGLSFRTAEALALKKKIITNRNLKTTGLDKFKDNILSFDLIDKIDLKEFINRPYIDPKPEDLKQFDIKEQIKNYLK